MGKGYRVMLTGTALMLAFSQCAPVKIRAQEAEENSPPSEETDINVQECEVQEYGADVDGSCLAESENPGQNTEQEAWNAEEEIDADELNADETDDRIMDYPLETQDDLLYETETETAGEIQEEEDKVLLRICSLTAGDEQGSKVYDGCENVDIFWEVEDESGNLFPQDAVTAVAWLTNVDAGEQEVICSFALAEAYDEAYVLEETEYVCSVNVLPRPLKITVPDGRIESGMPLTIDHIRFDGCVCAEGFLQNSEGTSQVPEELELPGIMIDPIRTPETQIYYQSDGDNSIEYLLQPETDKDGNIAGCAGSNYFFDPELAEYGTLTVIPAEETEAASDKTQTDAENAPGAGQQAPDSETQQPENAETVAEETLPGCAGSEVGWQEMTENEEDGQRDRAETFPEISDESEKTDWIETEHTETEYTDAPAEVMRPAENVRIEIKGIKDGEIVSGPVRLSFTCSSRDYLQGSCSVLFDGPSAQEMPAARAEYEDENGIHGQFGEVSRDGFYRLSVRARNTDGKTAESSVRFTVNRGGSAFALSHETAEKLQNYTHETAFPVTVIETNLDEVQNAAVLIRYNGDLYMAAEQSDYTRCGRQNADGRYAYTYSLPAECLRNPGTYEVSMTTRDRAGNVSSNESTGCPIRFEIRGSESGKYILKGESDDSMYGLIPDETEREEAGNSLAGQSETEAGMTAGNGQMREQPESCGESELLVMQSSLQTAQAAGEQTRSAGSLGGSERKQVSPELYLLLCMTAMAAVLRCGLWKSK